MVQEILGERSDIRHLLIYRDFLSGAGNPGTTPRNTFSLSVKVPRPPRVLGGGDAVLKIKLECGKSNLSMGVSMQVIHTIYVNPPV